MFRAELLLGAKSESPPPSSWTTRVGDEEGAAVGAVEEGLVVDNTTDESSLSSPSHGISFSMVVLVEERYALTLKSISRSRILKEVDAMLPSSEVSSKRSDHLFLPARFKLPPPQEPPHENDSESGVFDVPLPCYHQT